MTNPNSNDLKVGRANEVGEYPEAPKGEAVVVRNVSMAFSTQDSGEFWVLKNVDLSIRSGELYSILGPSGCGKSTLLYLIAGLLKPTSGEIFVNGSTVTGPGRDRALVFQEFGLLPWATVIRNVEFGMMLRRVARSARRQQARAAIKLVDLERFENYYPHQLSGGMKQRVGLARALALNPDIFLMDEPFGALDPMTRELMQEELLQLFSGKKLTIIFVTHSIDEAIFLSNRIAIFTARPGTVKEIVKVEYPHDNRRAGFKTGHEFTNLRSYIWDLMKEEARRSMSIGEASDKAL